MAVYGMIIGHSLLAFGLLAVFAAWRGLSFRSGAHLAAIGAGFAMLPDIDVVLAVPETLALLNPMEDGVGFSDTPHRTLTHSLFLLAAGSGLCTAAYWTNHLRRATVILVIGFGGCLALLVRLFSIPQLHLVTVGLFAIGAIGLTGLAVQYTDVPGWGFALACGVGLLLHPFGDVFTGSPPAFFAPLDVVFLADRLTFAADPTLNVTLVFLLELITAWMALIGWWRLDPTLHITPSPSSLLGCLYAVSVVVATPLTDEATLFVYSVLPLGLLGGVGVLPFETITRQRIATALSTGLMAVTLAVLSYGAAYGLVGL